MFYGGVYIFLLCVCENIKCACVFVFVVYGCVFLCKCACSVCLSVCMSI